jgi:hypothetical protein
MGRHRRGEEIRWVSKVMTYCGDVRRDGVIIDSRNKSKKKYNCNS